MTYYLLIGLISLLLSGYGALVGFGGGVFIIPILVLIFHYPIEFAIGAVTLSLVPSSILTTLLNNKHGFVDYKTGIVLETPTVIGVILGSLLVTVLPTALLQYVFIIAITLVGLSFFKKKKEAENENESFLKRMNNRTPNFIKKDQNGNVLYKINYFLATGFGLLSGTLAGLLGIGGGFLKTPIMIKVFRIPAKIAAGTALFMIIITSITSSVSHYLLGHVKVDYTIPVIAGFIAGPFLGVELKKRIASEHLEKLIGFSLIVAAGLMLVNVLLIQQ